MMLRFHDFFMNCTMRTWKCSSSFNGISETGSEGNSHRKWHIRLSSDEQQCSFSRRIDLRIHLSCTVIVSLFFFCLCNICVFVVKGWNAWDFWFGFTLFYLVLFSFPLFTIFFFSWNDDGGFFLLTSKISIADRKQVATCFGAKINGTRQSSWFDYFIYCFVFEFWHFL